MSYWTDGIMGTADDRFGKAVNDPEWNFRVTTVEALAARVFKDSDPELATRSLATAEEDWKYAVEGLKTAAPLPEVYGASDELERIAYGVVASVELYNATGEQRYADEAVALGRSSAGVAGTQTAAVEHSPNGIFLYQPQTGEPVSPFSYRSGTGADHRPGPAV